LAAFYYFPRLAQYEIPATQTLSTSFSTRIWFEPDGYHNFDLHQGPLGGIVPVMSTTAGGARFVGQRSELFLHHELWFCLLNSSGKHGWTHSLLGLIL